MGFAAAVFAAAAPKRLVQLKSACMRTSAHIKTILSTTTVVQYDSTANGLPWSMYSKVTSCQGTTRLSAYLGPVIMQPAELLAVGIRVQVSRLQH